MLTFVVNKIGDQPDNNLTNSSCDVSVLAGSQCTLRAAIQQANASVGLDAINFHIGSSAKAITPTSALPTITDSVRINGYSQPGAAMNTATVGTNAALRIVIDGAKAGVGANGLVLAAEELVIKGLVIQRFDGDGMLITAGHDVITGNYIGVNLTGAAARPNGGHGIAMVDGYANKVGGFTPGVRNVISANGDDGILVTGGQLNHIEGNYIGTNAAGTAALGNIGAGVALDGATIETVGGGLAGARNLISGNSRYGVLAQDVTDLLIAGNLIGTDATGLHPMGNGDTAVMLLRSDGNTIGGTLATQRNVISANSGGIELNSSEANIIQGNRIGTKADGTGDLGNDLLGIHLLLSDDNVVGNGIGQTGAGNVVAHTNSQGILVGAGSNRNLIQGNSVIGNQKEGLLVTAGPTKILNNVIVGNGKDGVKVDGSNPFPFGVRISGNQMFSNSALGINLGAPSDNSFGVTANDPLDADTGPNSRQNFPVLTSLHPGANGVTW